MPTRITLQQGDITALDVEAIVNSANNDLVLGGGVSGALRRIAGPALQDECNAIGTIPLGEAVVTGGGSLKAKWVIHAATNPLGLWADAKSVRVAARNVYRRAVEKGIKSLAVPAIGTGAGGFPIERCADVLLDELAEHVKGPTPLESVVFVLYEEKSFKAFEERFIRKMPEAWCEMTGKPLPELPPEPPPEPEPPPLPPRPPPRPPQRPPQRPQQQQGRGPQPQFQQQRGPGGPPPQGQGRRDRRRRRRGRGPRPPGGPPPGPGGPPPARPPAPPPPPPPPPPATS